MAITASANLQPRESQGAPVFVDGTVMPVVCEVDPLLAWLLLPVVVAPLDVVVLPLLDWLLPPVVEVVPPSVVDVVVLPLLPWLLPPVVVVGAVVVVV